MVSQPVPAWPGSAQAEPIFPGCPLCGAPPLNRTWRFDVELEHDCNCHFHNELAYVRAMQVLWRKYQVEHLFTQRLPQGYRHCTLENYRPDPRSRLALEAAQQLHPGQSLYLWGSSRRGKTHLAVAALRRLVSQGQRGKFWGEVELLQAYYRAFQHDEPPPDPLPYDALVLDDFGKAKPSDYVRMEVYGLLEHYAAHGKTLIVTSNYDPTTAALRLSQRETDLAGPIAARLGRDLVVCLDGNPG